jgi:hypothetical protein
MAAPFAQRRRREDGVRITCTHETEGTRYRIYRSDDSFVEELRRLVPFLHHAHCDVCVGGEDCDPDVVLTVGPLSGDTEQAFRKRVRRYLDDAPNG